MTRFRLPDDLVPPPGAALDADGVWCQLVTDPSTVAAGSPALFLDRDGVLVDEVHYLHRVDDMRIADGAIDVVRDANAANIPVIVVTNQAGIGRGFYGWGEFAAVQDALIAALTEAGAYLDAVYACPFGPEGIAPYVAPDHPARKPNPGMLTRALAAYPIDAARCWIIGDRAGDVEAGRRAGLAGGIHVACGHGSADGERDKALASAVDGYQVIGAADLIEARRVLPALTC